METDPKQAAEATRKNSYNRLLEPGAPLLCITAGKMGIDDVGALIAKTDSGTTDHNLECDNAQAFPIGTEIGPYLITGQIGQGGMGIVYSARDSRLHREVALKFVREIQDPSIELLEREARTASSLNHPNIVTVHEVFQSASTVAIVMERVDGVMLRRLLETTLPVARAVDIGRQIAAATAFAHLHGIIHRDLKPENVMVRADGYVKVLDFGLARHVHGTDDIGGKNVAGTLRYMSPEQARGEPITGASDVYSLGLILHELCTGTHPFAPLGPSGARPKIKNGAPPVSTTFAAIPGWLSELIARMLQSNPLARPSASEVVEALSVFSTRDDWTASSVAEGAFGAKTRTSVGIVVAASAMFAFVLYFLWSRTAHALVSILDTRVDLGTASELEEEGFALSPDGNTLLFVAGGRLNYVSLEGGRAQPWKGAEQGRFPFWSPDGKEAGFLWRGKMWRKAFPDGALREICDAVEPLAASWGRRNTIVFSSGDGPILRVPASGGVPSEVTKLSTTEDFTDRSPTFLPDGSRFVFFRKGNTKDGVLMLGATDGTHPPLRLTTASTSAALVPRLHSSVGALVYGQERKLLIHPFNLSTGAFAEAPFVLTERAREFRRRVMPASASASGAIVYAEAEDKTDHPRIFNRNGHLLAKLGQPREYVRAIPSADFRQFAIVSREPNSSLYALEILDRQSGTSRTLSGPFLRQTPVWSRDGKRILYTSERDGGGSVLTIQDVQPVAKPETRQLLPYPSWLQDASPDGKLLLLTAQVSETDRNIWVFPLDKSRIPTPLVRTPGKER